MSCEFFDFNSLKTLTVFAGEYISTLKTAYKIPRKLNEQPAPPGTTDLPIDNAHEDNNASPLAALPSTQVAGFTSLAAVKLLLSPPPPPPPPLPETQTDEKSSTRKRPHGMP